MCIETLGFPVGLDETPYRHRIQLQRRDVDWLPG